MPVTAKPAGPFACAFWLQRHSLIPLVTSNDSFITFLSVPLFYIPHTLYSELEYKAT